MRKALLSALATLALSSLVGCVGSLNTGPQGDDDDDDDDIIGPDAGGGDEGQARLLFDSTVKPFLQAACSACHAGTVIAPLKYLGPDPAGDYYPYVVADSSVTGGFDPVLSNLIGQGLHDGGNARALTQGEIDLVSDWMILEAAERGVDPTDPGGNPVGDPTSRDLLAQFSACMSIDDWIDTQMGDWADKGSTQGACYSCHTDGAGGFIAPQDENLMYEMNKYEIFIKTFFTTRVETSGAESVVPNLPKLIGKSDTVGHPEFNAGTNDEDMIALEDFYQRTMARKAAGTCPPAGFPIPTP
jgi:hypothetical protein